MAGPLSTLAAYLLGSIPFGYLIVRWRKGIDVRSTGSRSTGATNVMRNLGMAGFLATFILDAGKGTVAVLLARKITADEPGWVAAAALAAILGHCLPVWLKFRGGKGVATGVGAFLALGALPLGIVLVIFAVVVAASRYISLGSVLATAAYPVVLFFLNHPPLPILLGSVASAAVIIATHHANIRRLLSGTENRLGQRTITSGK